MSEIAGESCVPKPRAGLVGREVRGEFVVVDTETGDYHVFNELGGLMWKGLSAGHAPSLIVSEIVAGYRVTPERARADYEAFVAQLARQRLLQ